MEVSVKEKAQKWLQSNTVDPTTKSEIEKLLNSPVEAELVDSFYKDLEFGTGGLRGVMGVGSNRINKYTIGMATQGLANYLLKTYPDEEIKVAIAHDNRNNSRYFSEITAAVLSANGIYVYLFEDLRPTPELSFAVRALGCHSGIVVTASHNPKEYNGYKVYWNDGAQVVPPHDKNIISEVNAITSIDEVQFDKDESKIEIIGKAMDEKYLDVVTSLSLSPQAIKNQHDLKIVFTPIHGTAITLVPTALERMGFTNVTIVEEQAEPDGNFPTVVYPNPEETEALSIALQKARELDADLVMGTDPDGDRVGIAVKNEKGEFQLLNGNQTGSMLVYYLLKKWKENGKINGKQFVAKTIVTTDLIANIAAHYGVKCYETLTGFKYIAALIGEKEGKEEFIGGGEESYGYLIGDAVRDKDAVASCIMIAEMVAYIKDQGQEVFDFLLEMYQQFGLYKEHLISLTKKGKSGLEEIQQMMLELRENPPTDLAGEQVVKVIDYKEGYEHDMITDNRMPVHFPTSDVLQFITEKGSKISARPSGTEPKIKFYVSVSDVLENKADYHTVGKQLDAKIKAISESFNI